MDLQFRNVFKDFIIYESKSVLIILFHNSFYSCEVTRQKYEMTAIFFQRLA